MSYDTHLPQAFPWRFDSTPATIRYMVKILVDPNREDAPLGTTSFAVVPLGSNWALWMSDNTKKFLVSKMRHIEKNLIEYEDDDES